MENIKNMRSREYLPFTLILALNIIVLGMSIGFAFFGKNLFNL
jgi:hypothetical protein